MRIVAREQAEELRSREARRVEQEKSQATAALEHSQLRHLRALRLARLKVTYAQGNARLLSLS